jgi:hypothetical protein
VYQQQLNDVAISNIKIFNINYQLRPENVVTDKQSTILVPTRNRRHQNSCNGALESLQTAAIIEN